MSEERRSASPLAEAATLLELTTERGAWEAAQSEPGPVDPAPPFTGGERYVPRRQLGVGGMGEVTLTADR